MMGIPHYAIEGGPFAPKQPGATSCPVCGKQGRWMGDRFVPANEKGPPRCYCKTIFSAGPGTYAYDPETKTFLRRAPSFASGEAGGR